ncbi:MAG: transcription termination/antitermination protein NusG [Alphaproteobacteria bacterium]|nr:transcription termination/antitermination protein NusG [Alphaproteobacteria bacterium]MBN2779994.1 transcription termination/antitermination protein NusG [Alphaproteobacteria bacterium]
MTQKARWYIAQVQSGSEGSAVKALKEKIERNKMEELFEEILIPTHEITEVKQGKRVQTEKKFFPGYIMLKMVMNEETWQTVRGIKRVTGFLSAQNKPVPLSQAEADKLIKSLDDQAQGMAPLVTFQVGDRVKVIGGAFASFSGTVEAVDDEKQRLKVSVLVFGRPTQVDLEFAQAQGE